MPARPRCLEAFLLAFPFGIMNNGPHESKRTAVRKPLHRSEIAGGVAWSAVIAFAVAVVLSPGGDPYSVVSYTVVLVPAAIVNYWIGFRHGRRSRRADDVSTADVPAPVTSSHEGLRDTR